MTDLYFTQEGDIATAPSGDLGVTTTTWRDDLQQVYVRVMTDRGDFLLYPELGASLSSLFGLPQSPETGQEGVQLIQAALQREGRFTGKGIEIVPIPTGAQSIRFDVYVTSSRRDQVKLSVEQKLGAQ